MSKAVCPVVGGCGAGWCEMNEGLRAGYKRTEVGVIPVDWEVGDLEGACAETITYGIVQCGPHIENGVPYIRVSDMNGPNLDVNGMLRTSQAIAARFSRSQVKECDVVYALRGQIGEVRIIDKSVAGANLTQGTARLIAKKQGLKVAAMQQLLTGQTRLPGFSGEWEVKRLGDVGVFLKGSGVKKDESQSGSLPSIRYGEIYTRHNDYIKEFHSFISAKVAATACLLKKGDLLFAGSGETKAEIGKCVAFVDDLVAYAGGDIVILRPQAVDSLYLGFSLNTPTVNQQKASCGQGDAVVHIGSSALADVTVNLPPVPEQTAIAAILSDMDTELAALQARRSKTQALKQAMMQELLTGRIRLI